jgi:hypothetical protein
MASREEVDIPPARAGCICIHHLLGRVNTDSANADFAIHEEDALEYLYRIRDIDRSAKELFTRLRRDHRLFLGCSLPDWMGRGLLRLVNDQRLSADERQSEFFCAMPPGGSDEALGRFLARFSPVSYVLPRNEAELVGDLLSWQEAAQTSGDNSAAAQRPPAAPNQGASIFISYASEDAAAARRLADQLLQLGFGDVWLDQKRLRAGDDWSNRIEEAIAACDYVIPVLSHHADGRRTGVYWREWRLALEHARDVKGSYLLPVGIDADPPTAPLYPAIFSGDTRGFSGLHLTHAPQGELGTNAANQFAELARALQTEVRHG